MTAPTDNGEFPGSTPRPWGPSGTNMIVSPTREEVRQRMAEGNFPITSKRICSTENPTYMTPEEETANRDLILSAVNNHDHLTAEVRRLTDEVAAYRNAANYWYMVCKQDRGESVPRWSTDESDDRAMHEAAKDRQALVDERDRLKVAAAKARDWLNDIVPDVGGSWLKGYYAEGYGPEIREVIAQLTALTP